MPKVLYILSVGHSGSTLLDIMLGAHPQGVSVGELTFNGPYLNVNSTCSCSADPLLACPNWKAVDQELGAGESGLGSLRLAGPGTEDNNERFYGSICRANGADFVVESSKSVARLRDLLRCANLDLHVILLTRRPAAVLASHVRRGRSFLRYLAAYLINVPSQMHLAGRWHGSDVLYEELVTDPIHTIARIYNRAGIGGQWPADSWQEQEYHLSGGNPIRFKRSHELKLDTRWQSELSNLQCLTTAIVANKFSLRAMTFLFSVLRYVRSDELPKVARPSSESKA